jgi:hypothetical protein
VCYEEIYLRGGARVWTKSLSLALASLLICGVASAEGIQAQCGAEAGRAFALEGGLVNANNAGWYDDAMIGETVIRIDLETGTADVRFRDATGLWQSVSDQGGTAGLWAVEAGPPSAFMVTVMYPGATIETLTIGEVRDNTARLIHTVSRVTDRITNSRVMTAHCIVTPY